MGYRLKSIVDCCDGSFEISMVPCSDCVIRISKSNIDKLLQCLPKNPFTVPFEIQMKETESEGIESGRIIGPGYFIRFSGYQDWISCNLPFEKKQVNHRY